MEKTDRSAVISLSADWSDVGFWSAIRGVIPQDGTENVLQGEGLVLDVKG